MHGNEEDWDRVEGWTHLSNDVIHGRKGTEINEKKEIFRIKNDSEDDRDLRDNGKDETNKNRIRIMRYHNTNLGIKSDQEMMGNSVLSGRDALLKTIGIGSITSGKKDYGIGTTFSGKKDAGWPVVCKDTTVPKCSEVKFRGRKITYCLYKTKTVCTSLD